MPLRQENDDAFYAAGFRVTARNDKVCIPEPPRRISIPKTLGYETPRCYSGIRAGAEAESPFDFLLAGPILLG